MVVVSRGLIQVVGTGKVILDVGKQTGFFSSLVNGNLQMFIRKLKEFHVDTS